MCLFACCMYGIEAGGGGAASIEALRSTSVLVPMCDDGLHMLVCTCLIGSLIVRGGACARDRETVQDLTADVAQEHLSQIQGSLGTQ